MKRFLSQFLPRPPAPVRVGVLNTGELVLVDSHDHAQVITSATTDLVRDTLAHFYRDLTPVPERPD